jgi:thymidylate synthase (FAD)
MSPIQVEYDDHGGTDLSVVNAARVSFAKRARALRWELSCITPGPEVLLPVLEARDIKLINYLARENHWTPFGHTWVKVIVKAPIFVARQLAKHQVGLVWNEESRRYITDDPEFFDVDQWRHRPDGSIKQGSGGPLGQPEHRLASEIAQEVYETSQAAYQDLLALNVAPELARMVLPQATMTTWVWSGNVQSFSRVCKLRLDPHAQAETAQVAGAISNICNTLFPVSWAALMGNPINPEATIHA